MGRGMMGCDGGFFFLVFFFVKILFGLAFRCA